MKPSHELNPYLEKAISDHEELHRDVNRLHNTLMAHDPDAIKAETVAKLLADVKGLCGKLQRHFVQEEQDGGYLEEALALAPHLRPQANKLQKQHAEFCLLIGMMINEAMTQATPADAWRSLQEHFETFAKKLHAHEAAEDALLQEAFNEDLGLQE